MADGETGSQLDAEHRKPSDKPRLPYEKPALKHLGSVNKLTLLVSRQRFSDGTHTKATRS